MARIGEVDTTSRVRTRCVLCAPIWRVLPDNEFAHRTLGTVSAYLPIAVPLGYLFYACTPAMLLAALNKSGITLTAASNVIDIKSGFFGALVAPNHRFSPMSSRGDHEFCPCNLCKGSPPPIRPRTIRDHIKKYGRPISSTPIVGYSEWQASLQLPGEQLPNAAPSTSAQPVVSIAPVVSVPLPIPSTQMEPTQRVQQPRGDDDMYIDDMGPQQIQQQVRS